MPRVITGTARGRVLLAVPGTGTRPTSANVKEAVFSSIQFELQDRNVLDLFAGTAQMGIECLSRGSARATFVERDREALRVVRENVKSTGFTDRSTIIPGDALVYLERCREQYGIIFLDPPYATDLLEKCLEKVIEFDILAVGGIIVCESASEKEFPPMPAPYRVYRQHRYGQRKITLVTREA